jgi:hypothetical protein
MAIGYTTYLIGPAALVGCGLFMLVYPLQGKVAKLAGKLRGKVVRITDGRVRVYLIDDDYYSCDRGDVSLRASGLFFRIVLNHQLRSAARRLR